MKEAKGRAALRAARRLARSLDSLLLALHRAVEGSCQLDDCLALGHLADAEHDLDVALELLGVPPRQLG